MTQHEMMLYISENPAIAKENISHIIDSIEKLIPLISGPSLSSTGNSKV